VVKAGLAAVGGAAGATSINHVVEGDLGRVAVGGHGQLAVCDRVRGGEEKKGRGE